ncbi:MAG: HAMP domain-containing sensor histidine kinase [Campylobacterota bacterium]|nr:HAMP domain-containing sensor histidine kinase [Campylobacterota bacterium]
MKTESECNDALSTIIHDLRSPLSAVVGAFDILSFDDLTKTEIEQSIKSGQKAAKSIISLTENILVMAREEAGKSDIEIGEVCNLKEHFSEIANTFKYEMKVKEINFQAKIAKNIPSVYWDIDKLRYHAFNNIISNAIKFTDKGGNIVLKVKEYEGTHISVSIKDDGVGIPKEKRASIFEKYDTHDDKKVFKGTGLGLYNAYNFINKHNGNIVATKGIDGKGTGFNILLPIHNIDTPRG